MRVAAQGALGAAVGAKEGEAEAAAMELAARGGRAAQAAMAVTRAVRAAMAVPVARQGAAKMVAATRRFRSRPCRIRAARGAYTST